MFRICVSQTHLISLLFTLFNVHHYRQAQSKSPIDVPSICDVYFKYCDKSNKMASDHRYAHEYGDITMAMPAAPSTPKSSRPRSSRSTRIVQKEEAYHNPKDMFNSAVSTKNVSLNSEATYTNPKDMFNNAVSEQNKNSGLNSEATYNNPKDMFNSAVSKQNKISFHSDATYTNPKDMFQKALNHSANESSQNGAERILEGGESKGSVLPRNGLRSEKTVVVTAKTVKDLVERDTGKITGR